MEAALIAHLLAQAGITALVGNRINWLRRPQGEALPAMALQLVSGVPDYLLDGSYSLTESRVQMDAWAKSFLQAKQIARAVEAALSGQRFTQSGVRFAGVFIASERDDTFDETPDTYFRTSLDLMVHHASAS